MRATTAILSLLSSLRFALAQPYATTANTSSIQWTNCTAALPLPGACGTLAVPLDYTDIESAGTLNLSLFKINAAVQPSRGSILINPGGPGNDAGSFLQSVGDLLLV